MKSTFPQFSTSLDDVLVEESNDIFDYNDLDYDDDLGGKNLDDIFNNDINDSTGANDFIEAYNPNVKVSESSYSFIFVCYIKKINFFLKIPRPKLQFNPLKIFKVSHFWYLYLNVYLNEFYFQSLDKNRAKANSKHASSYSHSYIYYISMYIFIKLKQPGCVFLIYIYINFALFQMKIT